MENHRLQFIRRNQDIIRADLYAGAVEALGRNDLTIGRPIILPSSFIGGPRHMSQLYHDAMALYRHFGQPSFFITMTANDNWPEVQSCLRPSQTASDRFDILNRVFRVKVDEVIREIKELGRLGDCVCHVDTIEFQLRGRPHVHMIFTMSPASTPKTPDAIDLQVSAQLPDKEKSPLLWELVTTFMLHGPCKAGSACWKQKGYCRFRYPRPFSEHTVLTDDAYPNYSRPNNGRSFTRNGYTYTNQDVVPHNIYFLLKFRCHINTEVAVSISALKYLYKYITKGHDKVSMSLTANDEVLRQVENRAVSASEGQHPKFTVFNSELATLNVCS